MAGDASAIEQNEWVVKENFSTILKMQKAL